MSQPEPGNQPEKPPFNDLVIAYQHLLFTIAQRRTKNRESAEDAVQETFLRAYRAYGTFDGRYPKAWLITILTHHLNSKHRKAGRNWTELIRRILTTTDGSGSEDSFEDVDDVLNVDHELELKAVVGIALQELPAETKEVITLVVDEGLALDEAAEILGTDVASLRELRDEGLQLLRRALVERLPASPSSSDGAPPPTSPMVESLLDFIATEGRLHFDCTLRRCVDEQRGPCLKNGATKLAPAMLAALEVFVRVRSWFGDPQPTLELFAEFRARLGAHLQGSDRPDFADFADDLAAMDLGKGINQVCLLLTARALDVQLDYPRMLHAGGQANNHSRYRGRKTGPALWVLEQAEAAVNRHG